MTLDGREAMDRQAALYRAAEQPPAEHAHDPRDEPGFRSGQRVDQLRVPPQDVSAEQAVLGGLMLAPHRWSDVADILSAESFYRRDHQLIYTAIKHLEGKRKPFDAVTLGDWFERNGKAELIGGGAYLIDLASTTPSAANIRAYAEIVADKARLRELIELGVDLMNAGYDTKGRETVDIIGEGHTRLGRLLQSEPCELEELTPVLSRMFDNLQRRYERDGELDGLSTGLNDLDEMLNGLKGGRLYVIAAPPKSGKTTLAQNITEAVAVRQQKPVAFFSFEMPQEELAERFTCSIGGISYQNFRTGRLEDEEWAAVTGAIRTLRRAPIRLSRPRSARIESLCAQARRLHAKKPQALFVVDYLQLMETKGAENRTQGMAEVSRQLKMLAIDLDVPVIALSQLNREFVKRPDKRPLMSDLRDSGAIEQDADAIIFVYRDELYNASSPDRGTAELIVGAQRAGPTGTVRARTRFDQARFENLPADWQPAVVADSGAPRSRGRGFGKGSRRADLTAGDA